MSKRKLKRQLNLAQVVMLGTAGAVGGEIFVLTGHAAGISDPSMVLALIIGGVLSFSIALNYGELASTYPETGGAMTYVREAWGKNLLSYLVGSLDCLSSVFFAGLSAIGFSYSLSILLPTIPIVPVAIGIIIVFIVLNLLGVSNIGNIQLILGGLLLMTLIAYIISGFLLPGGFKWETFLYQGKFFIYENTASNFSALLSTIGLVYVAYIGFEVIADDAEEVKNPNRNLPLGILLSLSLLLIVYPLVATATLGTIPWVELAGSEVALTDSISKFLPGIGPLILSFAGIIASITSLNTAMLSATREAFTLSRDGQWPRILSKLGESRTPYAAILFIGGLICIIAAIGLVDFLSFISSSGYLFVLFFSNLALIRLRKMYPNLARPFKAPLFPFTSYLAMGTCLIIIAFTDRMALIFGLCLLGCLCVFYYLSPFLYRIYSKRIKTVAGFKNRILVPISNPVTCSQLVRFAAILAQSIEDTSVCVFHVTTSLNGEIERINPGKEINTTNLSTKLPDIVVREVQSRNVPLYSKVKNSPTISAGILEEVGSSQNINMIFAGWPGPLKIMTKTENLIQTLLEKAPANLAVLMPNSIGKIHNILVPVGGGPHSRFALHLAYEIAEQENSKITVFHTHHPDADVEQIEDETLKLHEIIQEELRFVPARLTIKVSPAISIQEGILYETSHHSYELLVMGASEEYGVGTWLFGFVDDWIIEHVTNCSVLLARQYEPAMIHWIRRHIKMMERD